MLRVARGSSSLARVSRGLDEVLVLLGDVLDDLAARRHDAAQISGRNVRQLRDRGARDKRAMTAVVLEAGVVDDRGAGAGVVATEAVVRERALRIDIRECSCGEDREDRDRKRDEFVRLAKHCMPHFLPRRGL